MHFELSQQRITLRLLNATSLLSAMVVEVVIEVDFPQLIAVLVGGQMNLVTLPRLALLGLDAELLSRVPP